MAATGLARSIAYAAAKIDIGRKGFATRGKAEEGRISNEDGIAEAMTAFKDSASYHIVEEAIPHDEKYRVKIYPRDAFHIACVSHRTRLQNILKSPGIDEIEKDLLKQQLDNLKPAQNGYSEKQKKALAH